MTLLDSRGHVVQEAFPATGHLIDGRFSFSALAPGRYTLQTRVGGQTWKRTITIVSDREIRANIVIPIK